MWVFESSSNIKSAGIAKNRPGKSKEEKLGLSKAAAKKRKN